MAGVKQPDDKSHFILPDLGEGVHEAELIKWRVNAGDAVKEHQTIAEMETDKALVEVPSPWTGVISELCGNPGDIINVGSVLVRYQVGAAKPAVTAPKAASPTQPARAPAAPAVKAAEASEDAGTVVGTMSGSLGVPSRFARKPEHESVPHAAGKALATPAVRRIARDLGVDIGKVHGTGRGGRVTATDVEGASRGGREVIAETTASRVSIAQPVAPARTAEAPATIEAAPVAPPAPLPAVSQDGIRQRIPFRGVRRKIAQALDLSVKTAVHFTVVDQADVTALDRKRKEYAAILGTRLSMLPFIMLAVTKALRKHPALNANVDDAREEILLKEPVHLGCAVDTDHGLMVPVIRNAERMSVGELANAVRALAKGCKERSIAREDLVGGTFTISNVGSYGGMFATPIINYPEVAILAAGKAKEQVLTRNGAFYAGLVLPLSLSCDHRVVDGAEGARFLNTVVGLLESADELLVA
jgi:pyruvate dehydrogenase E2 component (dihydrolipoamide acetyltransferase)